MADTDLQFKAMDALVLMHTAIKNMQLYPPASPTIANSIERLYQRLREILKMESPFVFAESGKKALLRGKLLTQKDQDTIHVTALLDILLNLGVKDIFFDKGMTKEELSAFIKIISKRPEAIFNEGGLDKLMTENKISHIYPDKKIYVAVDKDKEAVSDRLPDASTSSSDQFENDDMTNHVMEYLFNENADIRIQASTELTTIIEPLAPDEQINLLKRISGKLAEWIKRETLVTPAYKKICDSLQMLLQNLILQEQFAEAIPILDVFSDIHTGLIEKENNVREVSRKVLEELASQDNIQILFRELNANDKHKENEATHILAKFDDMILNKLLDMVKDITDSNERVRVIHLIRRLGHRAIPSIQERISDINAPWYYLRNLAYILGHIGNEESTYILQPLLLHKNDKVRMEALKSIVQTGRNQRGPLLLSVLPQAEKELKLNIIETLGKIRCIEAVPNLLDMLKNKSSLSKEEQISLQQNICNALGAIGSPETINTLSEIAESKSFLGLRSYPLEVKYAAKRALASIARKQEEDAKE
ncbi:MAG: HEAT repeat domain-containing protein [Smithella sp.]|jgi:HEAT repeat protein